MAKPGVVIVWERHAALARWRRRTPDSCTLWVDAAVGTCVLVGTDGDLIKGLHWADVDNPPERPELERLQAIAEALWAEGATAHARLEAEREGSLVLTATAVTSVRQALQRPEQIIVNERHAAELVSLSHQQFRRLCAAGYGPRAVWVSERRKGFLVSDLKAWAAALPTAV